MKKLGFLFGVTFFAPMLAFAQTFDPRYPNSVIETGIGWLQKSITVIMVLLTIFFLISVYRYISEKDPKNLPDKRKVMINGIIGLFVAVSVWGIVRIFQNLTGTTYYSSSSQVEMTCPPGQRPRNGICQ